MGWESIERMFRKKPMKFVTKIRLTLLGLPIIWAFFVLSAHYELPAEVVVLVTLAVFSCMAWPQISTKCSTCGQRVIQIFDRSYMKRDIPKTWPWIPTVCPYCRRPLDKEDGVKPENKPQGPPEQTKNLFQ